MLEVQAAKAWGVPSMSAFWEMDDEDKAIIVAIYETEKMMEAVELQEAQPSKGTAVEFGKSREEAGWQTL